MDDFDWGEFFGDIESGLDLSGGDTSWIDDVDWGSMFENMDFSDLDLSGVIGDVGAGGLDAVAADLGAADLGTVDLGAADLGTVDLGAADLGVDEIFDPGRFTEDVEEQAGGFYGNVPGRAVYDPTTDTTELYDPTTDTIRQITHGDTELTEEKLADDFWRDTIGAGQEDIEETLAEDFWKTVSPSGAEQGDVVVTGKGDQDPFEVDQTTSRGGRDALTTGQDQGLGSIIVTGAQDQDPFEVDQITSRDETTALDAEDEGAGTIVITGKQEKDPFEIDQITSRDETDALKPIVPEKDPFEVDQITSRDETNALDAEDDGVGTVTVTGKKEDEGSILTDEEHVRTDVDTEKEKDSILTDEEHTRQFDEDSFLKKLIEALTSRDSQLLSALLGGLLGLANRDPGRKYRTYTGGPKKFMSARGPMGTGTRFTQVPTGAAQGGLMGLAAGGRPARYLAGGTDGMADKIQTSIDNKQPALLSHGEFVIPADVVSHLGNGNSDAGANVLYEMMAKVRRARTGTPKQGKQINPRKYTPV